MKKTIIFIVSVLLVFEMFTVPAVFADLQTESTVHKIIGELGIINTDVDSADSIVTRKLAALYVARMVNLDTAGINNGRYFVDVENGGFATNAINNLAANGIVSISDDRKFRPDENITYDELLKMLICALGYSEYAESTGGWTAGYYRTAASLGLSLSVNDKNKITVLEAGEMIYKTLRTPVYDIKNIKNGSITYQSGDLLIEQAKNVYIYEGTVEAVGGMSISNDLYGLTENKIVISGNVYNIKEGYDFSDYIGNYVEFYCYEYATFSEVILVEPDVAGSPQMEIDIKDVDEYDAGSLTYFKESSDRTYKVRLSSPKVIYNGELLTRDVKATMSSLNKGKVYIKDSNGDGTYDTLIVEDYDSLVISSVGKTNEVLYFKEGSDKVINIGDYDFVTAYDDSGNKIDILSVNDNSVVSVMRSKNKKYLKFLVSAKEFNGDIEAVGNDNDGKKYIIVNGVRYDIDRTHTTDIEKILQFRNTYYFRLDVFGEVVVCDFESSDGYMAGFLLSVDNSERKNITARIFTADNKAESFVFDDSVTIDGKKTNGFTKVSDRICEIFNVGSDMSLIEPQIIGYKLNSDRKVILLDTAVLRDGENEESSLTKVYDDALTERRYSICGSTRTIGRQAVINNNTKVFYIPYGVVTIDEDLCRVGNRTTLMIEDRSYYANVYNFSSLNEYGDVLLIYYTNDNIPLNSDARIPLLMFDKAVGFAEENGDICKKVYVYDGNEQKTISVPENVDLSNISRGDLISFTYDVHGNVKEGSKVKKYYGYADGDTPFDTWNEKDGAALYTAGDYRQNFQLSFGKLFKTNGNVIKLCRNESDGIVDITDLTNSGIAIYNKEQDTITVETGELLDYETVGEDCSRIVIRSQSSQYLCAYGYNK